MTNASAHEIVERYRAALGKGDFAMARTLMQDTMTFQGPLDTFNTADQYKAPPSPAGRWKMCVRRLRIVIVPLAITARSHDPE